MPKYIFTAKHTNGEVRSGEMVAKDEQTLAMQLRTDGFLLTSVKELADNKSQSSVSFLDRMSTVPLKEKLVFTRNLGVMIQSGLPIGRALFNLSAQTQNKRFKGIITDLHTDVQKGLPFSDALAKHPGVFDELFINMIRVGEVGGSLDESLEIVTIQMEKENELHSRVKGALTYPSVIVVAMIGVGVLMLTYILPQILGVFDDMDVTLPMSTQMMVGLSDGLKDHPILIPVVMIGTVVGLKIFAKTAPGKIAFSWFVLHLPVIKGIVKKVNSARFARIFSSLLRSGVSVIDALTIVKGTLANYYYKEALKDAVEKIQKGIELSKVISEYPKIFPIIVPQMLQVGEETGKTEEMMSKLATYYEEEVAQITKNLSSIIEPVLMVVIGGAVGFFAVSMMQPMYGILENMG